MRRLRLQLRLGGGLLATMLAAGALAQPGPGSPEAAYRLGLAYRNGSNGVARDAAQAVRWLGSAAVRGVPAAMFILSHMLAEGEGAPRDPAAARRWLDAAAQAEYPEALQELAMEERDPARAAELLREAAHAMRHRAQESGAQ